MQADEIVLIDDQHFNCTNLAVTMYCSESDEACKFSFGISKETISEMEEDVLRDVVYDMFDGGFTHKSCLSCARRWKELSVISSRLFLGEIDKNIHVLRYAYAKTPNLQDWLGDYPIKVDYNTYEVRIVHKVQLYNPAAQVAKSTELNKQQNELAVASLDLPGIHEFVAYPCTCSDAAYWNELGGRSLREIIMHLNDYHKWTRLRIAEWLDVIDDPENGVDLAFKVPEKEKV